jgi:hypothetical protein
MTKRQVRKTAKKNIFIHNDISNTANHLKKRIEEKDEVGDRQGIALDITACLVMLSFTLKSRLNFVGEQRIAGWKERRGFDKKVETLLRALELEPDFRKRPYSSIKELKDFRDTIAHGKPDTIEVDETVDLESEADYDAFDLRGEWERFLTIDFTRQCSEDIDAILESWLATAGIEVHQTISRVSTAAH